MVLLSTCYVSLKGAIGNNVVGGEVRAPPSNNFFNRKGATAFNILTFSIMTLSITIKT